MISFSADGQTIAISGAERTVKLWNARTGELRATLKGDSKDGFDGFAFSPDGRTIATRDLIDKTIRLWDVTTTQLKMTFAGRKNNLESKMKSGVSTAPDTEFMPVSFSPDGRILATASDDKGTTAKLWDTETGALRLALASSETTTGSIIFSPDGRLIVTTSDKGVKLWDAASGDLIATLDEARFPASFSPDGQTLATGGRNDTAMLWEITSKQ